MGEYQVIARKWRPQRFADVVGQQHVVRTLENAIRENRIAHAYLFVGPRGVGKTTLARIFAKAMNCEHPRDGEPCCQCASCKAVADESNLDVIEIDAASYNSVDDMRRLSEEALHRPVAGRFKIYIIDEVHMLSKAAWNALLKTIEEPPAHVKFIFATTEVHMVLPTIISRCQRFDLQPIPTRLIAERLRMIADAEKIKVGNDAIDAIARAAEGGMRDAQSLLDQMIAFFSGDNQEEISGAQVLSLFGLTDSEELDALLRSILTDDRAGVVTRINALAKKGKNLETLFTDILEMLRNVQLTQLLSDPAAVLDLSQEELGRSRELAKLAPRDTIQLILEVLSPVGRILHDALDKQILLECLIQKAMREGHAVRLNDLLKRLNQLRTAGELQFLDKLPPAKPEADTVQETSAQPEKKTPDTAPMPMTPPPVPEPEKVPEPPKAPEPEKFVEPPKAPEPEPVKTPKFDVSMLFLRLLERVRAEHADFAPALQNAQARLEGPELVLTLAEENAVRLHDILPALHAMLQDLTGDWKSLVKLESIPGGKAESKTPVATPEPQAVPEPEAAPEPEVEPRNNQIADPPPQPIGAGTDFEPVIDEDGGTEVDLSDLPAAPPTELPGETVSAADPEADTPEIAAASGTHHRESRANDPAERAAARQNPVVQHILDLFGGEIVDIHH